MQTNQPRDLSEVLDRMIVEIGAGRPYLREQLNKLKSSIAYTPPEGMYMRWEQGAQILEEWFQGASPESDWGQKLVDIWMGKL